MKIFPYILTRIGGGSFNNLTQVEYSELLGCLEKLQVLQEQKEAAKLELCAILLKYNKTLVDPKAQNQIQNVRRDIFNNRPLKPAAILQAKQKLPDTLSIFLEDYLDLLRNIQTVEEKAGSVYQQLSYFSRLHLQQLATDENLHKGLVLSSQPLLESVKAYIQKDPAAFKKKEFQTEQSLLKYLTRMYTKTSPFSTFNSLAIGTLSSAQNQAIRTHATMEKSTEVKGHIRLNNLLFRYLKDLFAASREIYRHLKLRPNPTIAQKANHFVYLTNHQNIEAFQRIPANPVMELLLELMQQQKAGIRFAALVQEVGAYVDASAGAIEQYIRQLVKYGFIEYELGISGTDPDWDTKLIAELVYLQQQEVAHIAELIHTLQEIRVLAGVYATAGVEERKQLLNDAYQQFRSICLKLHEAAGLPAIERKTIEELQLELQTKRQAAERLKKMNALEDNQPVLVAEKESALPTPSEEIAFEHKSSTFFHFKPEQLFYEDATRNVAIQYDESKMKKFITALSDLLQELHLFRGMADEREQMKQYFVQKYGTGSRISLLSFYEDFYRDIKRQEAQKEVQKRKENLQKAIKDHIVQNTILPHDEPSTPEKVANSIHESGTESKFRQEQLKQWMEQTTAAFRSQVLEQNDQIEIPLQAIRQVNEQPLFKRDRKKGSNSYGVFIQFYQEKDSAGEWQLKGVLNASFAGYGKMMSRFLHVFLQEITDTIREWNQQLQGRDELFIENGDASYFNANLHPPMMPYEIRTPGGHTALPVEKQLPITEFDVCLDEAGQELMLMHRPTAKRAYVFDLGFQGKSGRSPLFQLLDKFTKAEYQSVYPLVAAVNTAFANTHASSTNTTTEIPAGEKQIHVLPRIVYAESIILQRKGWLVPKELIPQRQPGMSDLHYYAAVNVWRKAQKIPDHVFVKVTSSRNTSSLDPELSKKLGRDDYKPQYIYFADPLLVHLFEKLVAKAPASLKIEEMLPNPQHLTQLEEQPFVTECMVQWYQ